MTKLINESSLFQHSFLIHYFNGNIFFTTRIYIIPFGYCKSQTKSSYFRSIDYISKYSHQKFRTRAAVPVYFHRTQIPALKNSPEPEPEQEEISGS